MPQILNNKTPERRRTLENPYTEGKSCWAELQEKSEGRGREKTSRNLGTLELLSSICPFVREQRPSLPLCLIPFNSIFGLLGGNLSL